MSAGDLAQLARASALQAEGQGFKSPNLHSSLTAIKQREGRAAFFLIKKKRLRRLKRVRV